MTPIATDPLTCLVSSCDHPAISLADIQSDIEVAKPSTQLCRAHMRQHRWEQLRPSQYDYGCPHCGHDYAIAIIQFESPHSDVSYQTDWEVYTGDYENGNEAAYGYVDWESCFDFVISQLEDANHPLLTHPELIQPYVHGTMYEPQSRVLRDILTEHSSISSGYCASCESNAMLDWS